MTAVLVEVDADPRWLPRSIVVRARLARLRALPPPVVLPGDDVPPEPQPGPLQIRALGPCRAVVASHNGGKYYEEILECGHRWWSVRRPKHGGRPNRWPSRRCFFCPLPKRSEEARARHLRRRVAELAGGGAS